MTAGTSAMSDRRHKEKHFQLSFHRSTILASFVARVDTCIRGDASSACRIDSGVCWGYEADRWHRILGRPEETAADVTGDEPQHCTSSTEAWEENTACNTAQRDSYLALKTMIFVITTHQWPQMLNTVRLLRTSYGLHLSIYLLCQCHQARPLGSVLLFLPSL